MWSETCFRSVIVLACLSACGGEASLEDAGTRRDAMSVDDEDASLAPDDPDELDESGAMDAGVPSDAATPRRDAATLDAGAAPRIPVRNMDISTNTLAITKDGAYVLVGHLNGGKNLDAGAGVVRLESDGAVSFRTQLLPDITMGGPYRQSSSFWAGVAPDDSIYVLSTNPMLSMPETSAGRDDVVATKLDRAGGVVWSKQFMATNMGNLTTTTSVDSAGVDAAGNLYLRAEGAMMKLNPAGEQLWKKFIPEYEARAIVDAEGNLYFTGYKLGPLPNLYETAHGTVRKYDPSGELLWQIQLDAACHPSSLALAAGDSKLYVSGFTTLDIRAASANKPITGGHGCVHQLDASKGDKLWSLDHGGAVMTHGDDVYVVTQDGANTSTRKLVRLNDRGEELWSSTSKVLGTVGRSAGFADGMLISTFMTAISRISLEDGRQVDTLSW